jgi:hypothetical protein
VHALVQRLADLGAQVEGRRARPVPRLDNDLALPDQVRVLVADIRRAAAPVDALRAAAPVDALRAAAPVDALRAAAAVDALRAAAADLDATAARL